MGDLYTALIRCGLSFKSGYYEAENDSMAAIIRWNQKRLDENFELGYTEHCSHDYKQVLFAFGGFSEVRVFIHNIKESDSVFFTLIIPEDNFVDWEVSGTEDCVRTLSDLDIGRVCHLNIIKKRDRMALIKDLAVRMWESGSMNSIQTGWEGSDLPARFDELVRGGPPNIQPFCIVPRDIVRPEWDCAASPVGRGGTLLENSENWFP